MKLYLSSALVLAVVIGCGQDTKGQLTVNVVGATPAAEPSPLPAVVAEVAPTTTPEPEVAVLAEFEPEVLVTASRLPMVAPEPDIVEDVVLPSATPTAVPTPEPTASPTPTTTPTPTASPAPTPTPQPTATPVIADHVVCEVWLHPTEGKTRFMFKFWNEAVVSESVVFEVPMVAPGGIVSYMDWANQALVRTNNYLGAGPNEPLSIAIHDFSVRVGNSPLINDFNRFNCKNQVTQTTTPSDNWY